MKKTQVQEAMEAAIINKLDSMFNSLNARIDKIETQFKLAGAPVTRPDVPQPKTIDQIIDEKMQTMKEHEILDTIKRGGGFSTVGWNDKAIISVCKTLMIRAAQGENKSGLVPTIVKETPHICDTCKNFQICNRESKGKENFKKCTFYTAGPAVKDTAPKTKKAITKNTAPEINSDKNPLGKREQEVFNMLKSGMKKTDIETALGVKVHGVVYSIKKKGYTV